MKRTIEGMVAVMFATVACNGDGDSSSTAGSAEGSLSSASASESSSGADTGSTGAAESSDGSAASSESGTASTTTTATTAADSTDSGGPTDVPSCEELPAFIAAFKESHSGNGGTDWDINAMTPAEVAADPDAQTLLALCSEPDQRPVIPELAWEYGGGDHQWISPEASAIYYCVYTPVDPGTEHWSFDEVAQLVEADVTIGCPEQNPCADQQGADQVMMCLGDPTNIEIIVDTASLDDGHGAGLELSEAATDLYLLFEDATRVLLYHDA